MINDYTKRAIKIIKSINYATIATASKGGIPWNSPVAHNYDEQLNIYWFSDKNNHHSRNVRDNTRVFIVIYDSTAPEGEGEGVYIQATAKELSDPEEIMFARRIKKGPGYDKPADDFLGDSVRRVYKATPEHIWINDAEEKNGVFLRDFRKELSLDDIRASLKK
ncbi:MAG: pyridoxamine 5'-phosphate oxidase family protein [Candidatus Saccharimonadales bacterium]